jgi:hypothetical protein
MSILFFTIIKVKRILVIIIIRSGTHFVVVQVVVLGFRIRVVKIAARLPPHHNISRKITLSEMTKISPKKSP